MSIIKLPTEETFRDCTGRLITFRIDRVQMNQGEGFTVEANEIPGSETMYEFSAWSPCEGDALTRLRSKIRKELAKKYLTDMPQGKFNMTHDEMRGAISEDGLIVDGRLMDWERLMDMLGGLPGAQFYLRIADETE